MARVVVLFEAHALAVQRSIDLVSLETQALEVGVVLAPAVGDRSGEVVAQQPQPVGSEQSAAHELCAPPGHLSDLSVRRAGGFDRRDHGSEWISRPCRRSCTAGAHRQAG